MLRVTFLTLLSTAASANILSGSALRAWTKDMSRDLQGDFDLDAFQFNFGGVNINATVAQEQCPNEWQAVVGCVIQTCPNFMDVCPELDVPAEFEGTAPPAAAPGDAPADEPADGIEVVVDGNMTATTDGEEVEVDEAEITVDTADDDAYVPTCEELDESYCERFGGQDLSECCMLDCAESLQSLVSCVVLKTTGEDRSNCEVPECPTMAPVASDSDGDREVASSSAVAVIPKMAALVASLVAFVML